MGRASDILKEFNSRLATLEAQTAGLQRIITSLEGLKEVVTRGTAGIRGDTDKFERAINEYLEQKAAAMTEIENLKAAHREVVLVISRLAPEYCAVLSLRYLAGLSQYEVAKRLSVPRTTISSREDHALAIIDYHLQK